MPVHAQERRWVVSGLAARRCETEGSPYHARCTCSVARSSSRRHGLHVRPGIAAGLLVPGSGGPNRSGAGLRKRGRRPARGSARWRSGQAHERGRVQPWHHRLLGRGRIRLLPRHRRLPGPEGRRLSRGSGRRAQAFAGSLPGGARLAASKRPARPWEPSDARILVAAEPQQEDHGWRPSRARGCRARSFAGGVQRALSARSSPIPPSRRSTPSSTASSRWPGTPMQHSRKAPHTRKAGPELRRSGLRSLGRLARGARRDPRGAGAGTTTRRAAAHPARQRLVAQRAHLPGRDVEVLAAGRDRPRGDCRGRRQRRDRGARPVAASPPSTAATSIPARPASRRRRRSATGRARAIRTIRSARRRTG